MLVLESQEYVAVLAFQLVFPRHVLAFATAVFLLTCLDARSVYVQANLDLPSLVYLYLDVKTRLDLSKPVHTSPDLFGPVLAHGLGLGAPPVAFSKPLGRFSGLISARFRCTIGAFKGPEAALADPQCKAKHADKNRCTCRPTCCAVLGRRRTKVQWMDGWMDGWMEKI